jgi:iron(III) transport system substrate-binding protein
MYPDCEGATIRALAPRTLSIAVTLVAATCVIATPLQAADNLGLSDAVVAKAKQEGTVNFYSSSRRNTLTDIAKKFKEEYGINVAVTRKATGNIIEQVETERRINRVSADVVQTGNEGVMLSWLSQGYFSDYTPKAVKDIPKEYQIGGGKLLSPYVNLQAPCFNTKALKPADAPKTYEAFLAAGLKGKVIVVDPRYAGPGPAVVRVIVKRYGWDFVDKLAKQKPFVVRGVTTLTSMVSNGESVLGLQCNTSQVAQLKSKGNPIDTIWLKDGIPTVFSTAGVVEKAPHPNAARLFLEFLLSKASAKILAKGGYKVSRPDVPDMIGKVPVPILVPDWDWLGNRENARAMNEKYMQTLQQQ